jgi:hypothetical protein
MNRRSYRGLSRLPAWGLYGITGTLVATIRAATKEDAARLFEQHGLRFQGDHVKRVT